MVSAIQLFVFIYALTATGVSLGLAIYFYRHSDKVLGRSLFFMLVAEAIANGAATVFAYTSWVQIYNLMSPTASIILRLVLITAAVCSSLHLFWAIRRIRNG